LISLITPHTSPSSRIGTQMMDSALKSIRAAKSRAKKRSSCTSRLR
jgi:hypothetical protein